MISWKASHFLVAQERVEFLKQKLSGTDPSSEDTVSVVATIKGGQLEHTQCKHPFIDRVSPIVLSDHVTTSAGTGLVHTAPGIRHSLHFLLSDLNTSHRTWRRRFCSRKEI